MLSLEDYDTSDAPLLAVYPYGFIFYVPDEELLEDHIEAMRDYGYSEKFATLLEYSEKEGYSIIRMDGDIATGHIEGLELCE